VTGLSDILPATSRRGRPPKYMHVHAAKSADAPKPVHPVPQTCSANSVQFTSSKTGDMALKTIIKGNIMYKRTESGEVIASVIKNGPQSVASISAAASAGRAGRPPSDPRVTASLSVTGETSLPADCPLSEDNVEHILDESLSATVSVRRTLVSLKDDLRRMGGGAVMSPALKPIHLQHRINIAYKLARAFADYRSTISAISSAKSAGRTVTSSSHSTSSSAKSASSTITLSPPLTCSQTARPTDVQPVAACASKPVPVSVASSSQRSTAVTVSKQKTARSTPKTVIRQTSSDEANVVSDDLWMSCEYD